MADPKPPAPPPETPAIPRPTGPSNPYDDVGQGIVRQAEQNALNRSDVPFRDREGRSENGGEGK